MGKNGRPDEQAIAEATKVLRTALVRGQLQSDLPSVINARKLDFNDPEVFIAMAGVIDDLHGRGLEVVFQVLEDNAKDMMEKLFFMNDRDKELMLKGKILALSGVRKMLGSIREQAVQLTKPEESDEQ